MKVKIMKVISVAVLMSVCAVFADTWTDPETGRTWTYRMLGDTAEITQGQYSDWTGDLAIPDRFGDVVVTSIGSSAFKECSGLSGSLTIPNSVTNVGDRAFNNCNNLTGSIRIPDSVTRIGRSAFAYCSSLRGSVTLSSSTIAIGDYAFYKCSNLTGPIASKMRGC